MRTQMMIVLIVLAVFFSGVAAVALVIWWLGAGLGALVVVAALATGLLIYLRLVQPWYRRWGATDEEVTMAMPGDELIAGGGSVTRAIGISAEASDVWPWLVQLGFGKAGWYSYDWIDNDFHPSATEILADHQSLEPGDKILMMPTMGFEVTSIDPGRSIVSLLEDGTTSWSLGLYPDGGGTRLVSRWRNNWGKITPANAFFVVLTDPGTFIMEQKMLRGIRDRAERLAKASGV